jgi:thiol:disulfide interchange protein
VILEEYETSVLFTAPIELLPGVKPEEIAHEVVVVGQLCSASCQNFKVTAKATFAGYLEAPTAEFRPDGLHVVLQGQLDTSAVATGGKAVLMLAAKPDEGWHVYAHAPVNQFAVGKGSATLITFTSKAGWTPGAVTAHPAAKVKKTDLGSDNVHADPVVWKVELSPPAGGFAAGELVGRLGLQTCQGDQKCDAPTAVEFRVHIPAEPKDEILVGFQTTSDDYQAVEKLAAEAAQTAGGKTKVAIPLPDLGQLGVILIFAFLGGAILNLMPCVLPVIGLKILSFARQGGQSHGRVLALNLSYSVGLISVFLMLAGLAAFLNFGWGDQFQNIHFKITMTAVVFVMALSFLGVWELPIPGFATSGKAGELQNQHGIIGAFFKGMFTTVLATPCSGPFLGAVFPFALKQQPAVIFLIFGCIGLGMASPYLMIGIFPRLIRFLPKPGEWMETFERVMGFVLLATVVYLFSTFGKEQMGLFVPTLALLIALWFGCWMIGQVPE